MNNNINVKILSLRSGILNSSKNFDISYSLWYSSSLTCSSRPIYLAALHSRMNFFASQINTVHSLEALIFENSNRALHISFLPFIILYLTTCLLFLALSLLFSIPNTSSTGANLGKYCGKNRIRKHNFFVICFVTADKWIEDISKSNSHSKDEKSIHCSI